MASYTYWLSMGAGSWSVGVTKNGSGTGAWWFGCPYSININGQSFSGSGSYDFRSWAYDQTGSITIASGSYSLISGSNTGSGTVGDGGVSGSYYYNPPQPTYTHKITYDANGGTDPPPIQTLTTYTQSSFTATLSNVIPKKSGYEFKGWVIDGTTDPIYYPSTSYDFNTQNVTLKAVWEGGAYTKVGGMWKTGTAYTKVEGVWYAGKPYVKHDGTYKR